MEKTYQIKKEDFDAIILADGDFPTHLTPLSYLYKEVYLCCCDGAGQAWINRGGMPHAIVGDGDSLENSFKERYKDIIHIVKEQDDNDLTKATRFCMDKGFKKILYLGATGKREDHTIANISLMVRYAQELGIQPTLITDHGYFQPAIGNGLFESFEHQQVSIFNFTATTIKSQGLKWDTWAFGTWWQGTLNEALGNSFKIEADGAYLVFRAHERKE